MGSINDNDNHNDNFLSNTNLTNMTQEEAWIQKYNAIVEFINKNRRNPSKHNDEERGKYVNWLRHNRKLFNAGEMKGERKEKFEKLLGMMDLYRRKNQYE